MKKYGAPDVELKDTRRNSAQSSLSTLRVAHLTHYHRQECCGVNFTDKQVIDHKIATCWRSTQRLQKTYTAHFSR